MELFIPYTHIYLDLNHANSLTNKMIVKDNMLQIEGFVLVKKIGSGWIGGWVEEPF